MGSRLSTRLQSVAVAFALVATMVVILPNQPVVAQTATLFVDGSPDSGCSDVPPTGLYCTIGAAVLVAVNGDVIEVAPATYPEAINTGTKVLTIVSTGGAAVTTIQAPDTDTTIVTVNIGNLTLSGFTLTGANVTSSANGGAVFINNTGGTATISDSIITGNTSLSRGGGIESFGTLTVINSTISNNTSGRGGGIFNSGTATITGSVVTGNNATTEGGGIYNATFGTPTLQITDSSLTENTAPRGGAISNPADATAIINRSLIAGNSASNGSGVWVDGTDIAVNDVQLRNTTLSGNAGGPAVQTGTAGGTAHLYFATVTDNPTGVASGAGTSVILARSLVAGNTADCSGSIGMAAFNLVGAASDGCSLVSVGTGDIVGTPTSPVDALLGPLADNGGPTLTHALLDGSPAIESAGSLAQACLPIDQRGVSRPQGELCDIGAFEAPAPVANPLQALIDAAGAGEIVDVPAATYTENITIDDGKTLRGVGTTAADVVIDGQVSGATVTIASGDATLENLTVTGGSGTDGGGVSITGTEQAISIIDVRITGNAAERGGGLWAGAGNTVRIERSTIDSNTANSDLGTTGGGVGGAADFTIVNSTFSANSTSGNGAGVGLVGGTASLNNVTLALNSAVGQGAAFNADLGAAITLSNTLSSGNSNSNGGPNCNTFVSLGHNVHGGIASGCSIHPTDILSLIPVEPLADNGGATLTHALPDGSPAIDAGAAGVPSAIVDYPVLDAANMIFWRLNGAAANSGNELLLASTTGPVGSAYLGAKVPVDQDFSAQFDFSSGGADGLTFTIGDNPDALGDGGGFLGIGRYDTIEDGAVSAVSGVSVEFDTHQNLDTDLPAANDTAPNQIGIDIDGSLASVALADVAGMSNGSTWTAWIDYSAATTTLNVRASNDGNRPADPTLSHTVNIAAFAGPQAHFGFTGSTGTFSGDQRIKSFALISETPACESTDQRTVARPQGDACDIGAFENDTQIATALTVDLADAGAIASAPPIIPIDELDIATFFGVTEGPSSTQLGAIQLGAIQLGAIAGTGLSAPSGYLTIETIIAAAAELSASPTILDGITLVDVPVTGGWASILATSTTLTGRPPYTVTLQQAIDDPAIGPGLSDLRLADSGLTASQLGAIQLGAIQLGAIQLSAIQLSAIQLSAIGDQLADICASGDIDCAALGITPGDSSTYDGYSLAALSLLGVSLDFSQLGAIQLGAIDPTGTQLSAIQLGAIQLGAIQLGAIGADSATIGNTQLGAIQLGAIQLSAISNVESVQLGAITTKTQLVNYWCDDPASELDCAALGVTTPSADGTELDDYSIVALGAMGADLSVLQLGAIQLGAIGDLASTQLGAIQLGAIQLGAIAPEDTQLSAIQLSAIQLGAIQLSAIDWDNIVFTQLGAIQLSAIQLSAIQLGAIQLSAISDPSLIVNCGALAGGCSANGSLTLADLEGLGLILPTATLDDLSGAFDDIPLQALVDAGLDIAALVGAATLLDLLPETTIAELPPDLTLGDLAELWVGMPVFELLLALLDPADLSWEDVDPAVIAAQHPVLASGWSVMFELAGESGNVAGSEFPFTADVSVTVPDGVTYVPGTSGLAINPEALPPPTTSLPDPLIDGSTLRWIVDGVELNDLFYVEFGLATAYTADTSVPVATTVNTLGFTGADSSPTLVTDLEPNDTFAQAVQVSGDVLVLGRVDTPGDVDMFKLSVPAGGSIEAYLNPGSVDLDLVLFEPGQTVGGELRGPAERVVEGSLDPVIGIDPTEQDQESLDDIANTDLAPVFKSSLHRGDASESIVTPPLRNGGDFYLQVTSYNDVVSEDVYVGRIRIIDPPAGSVCAARPTTGFNGEGIPGILPDVTGAETLYLINTELFADTHGATALNEVLAGISAVNGVSGAPDGVVVPVEGDGTVADAYDTWLGAGGNCSSDAANSVATAIAEMVDGYRETEASIASVVIVGGDDQIPFFRVEDQGIVANEREYLTTFSGNNPLVSSLRDGMVMTDVPYTDANPLYVPQGDREVFVTQLPTGRLVEEPAEIVATLNQFVASGGLLDAANTANPTAEVLGYDFLADSSAAIAAELTGQGFNVASTINESWTKADLEAAFDSVSAIVDSNAHYDHTAALPAEGNLSSTFTDLYTVADLEPDTSSIYAGTLIYSMGCHSGLNAPASYLSPTDPLYDWAQALLARQAVYVANTGFGFGDSEFQAYSEELMALMTEQFATSNTIGEAFRNAQQIFASQTPKWSPYHDKSLMEATLYGLPFYRLHATDVSPPALETITPGAVVDGLASAPVSAVTRLDSWRWINRRPISDRG